MQSISDVAATAAGVDTGLRSSYTPYLASERASERAAAARQKATRASRVARPFRRTRNYRRPFSTKSYTYYQMHDAPAGPTTRRRANNCEQNSVSIYTYL